jgi:CHAD domain-containing protein
MATSAAQPGKIGLGYWMQQVLERASMAADGFEADVVHNLRTALRRCRSMADGVMVFDPDPAWKKMRKSGKQLFQSLGALRDTHVLTEWVGKLFPESDPTAQTLQQYLGRREEGLRVLAASALAQFDRNRWSLWANELPARAAKIPLDGPMFSHLALERWHEARALHRRALRNRTNVAFHDLRIGVKRFRYTVENFLPSLHEFWDADLKELQDVLGDVHDLDVLWSTALSVKAFPDDASRQECRSRIEAIRQDCLQKYRTKMVGRNSLWAAWRTALPKPEQLRALGFQRLELWASLLDPNVRHSRHVARLALQLLGGLGDDVDLDKRETCRYVLQTAALMHDVGRSRAQRGHHKESARMIRKMSPPLGWSADEMRMVALIARYHRGALPSESQRNFSVLRGSKRWLVQSLGGILRLACACDRHDAHIRQVEIESSPSMLRLRAEGYGTDASLAEHLAAARYLLEVAYSRPVFIVPAESHAS